MRLLLGFFALAWARPNTCPAAPSDDPNADFREWNNEPGRPTIVVAVPKSTEAYYSPVRSVLIDFHVTPFSFMDLKMRERIEAQYAMAVLGNPSVKRDNFLITGDAETIAELKMRLGEDYHDILIESGMEDIWMRDPSPASMTNQVSFIYAADYIQSQEDRNIIQKAFNDFLVKYGASNAEKVNRKLDAGNVVDNFGDYANGKAVITKRFCKDNNILCNTSTVIGIEQIEAAQMEAVRNELRASLHYSRIALILDQGDTTGHSDGMVSFIDDNVLAVYPPETDAQYDELMNELKTQLPGTKLVEINSVFSNDNWNGFTSACGVHVNALATFDNIYVPTFAGDAATMGQSAALDSQILGQIRDNSCKKVIPIPVPNAVCRMGGSVRCLSYQVVGPAADKLILAARNNAQ